MPTKTFLTSSASMLIPTPPTPLNSKHQDAGNPYPIQANRVSIASARIEFRGRKSEFIVSGEDEFV